MRYKIHRKMPATQETLINYQCPPFSPDLWKSQTWHWQAVRPLGEGFPGGCSSLYAEQLLTHFRNTKCVSKKGALMYVLKPLKMEKKKKKPHREFSQDIGSKVYFSKEFRFIFLVRIFNLFLNLPHLLT